MTYTKDNVSVNALDKSDLIKSVANAETNINSQRASYSRLKNRENQLVDLTTKIFKTSVSYNVGIHPRIFCRRWFGLSTINKDGRPRFTEKQILAMELEHGYREKCINLIARILKVKPNTIHRWGKGVAFDKIPVDKRQKYEIYLGYVDSIRVITMSLTELDEDSLLRLLQRLENR
ncbi:MAG: hypothetical protein QNJ32_13335 [Xenococcaceae cyanobacterium MO_167.B27]|nr:hypothetical protein [Xenococcaceae cyanobacterium MO_167.B27]